MTLAIEPMISTGSDEIYVHEDQWSISTSDDSLAAHFEHTVAVTDDGPRILTAPVKSAPVCYHEFRAARAVLCCVPWCFLSFDHARRARSPSEARGGR